MGDDPADATSSPAHCGNSVKPRTYPPTTPQNEPVSPPRRYLGLPPAEVIKFVAARLVRQERLGDPAHRFTQITTEGALGWRAGSAADMIEQVDRIVAVSRLPTVRVGIVAWGTRAPVFPLHGWDLHDQRAVIYGTADATAVLTEPGDVARYVMLTAAVERIAVWDDAARAVLARISDRYRASGD